MATRMLLNVCKEVCKVQRWAQPASNLPRVSHQLVCPVQSSHLYSYCQSTGSEPDQLYKALEIEVKGHDRAVMSSYQKFVQLAARELDITISKIWEPPKAVIKRWTLLKSVHIYAKHKVQYETRTNYQTIEIKHITGSTADTFLEYIQRNLPEGMAMKVTRHAIEALPEHLISPDASSSPESKVKSQTST